MVIIANSMAQTAPQVHGPEAPHRPVAIVRDRQEVATPGKAVAAASEPKDAEPQPDPSSIDAAVLRLNEYLQQEQRTLEFSVDKDSGRVIITVTDSETNQVIRQIPSDEILALMRHLSDTSAGSTSRGVLLSEQA